MWTMPIHLRTIGFIKHKQPSPLPDEMNYSRNNVINVALYRIFLRFPSILHLFLAFNSGDNNRLERTTEQGIENRSKVQKTKEKKKENEKKKEKLVKCELWNEIRKQDEHMHSPNTGFDSFSLWNHTRVVSIVYFIPGRQKTIREKHTLKIPIFHTISYTLFYEIYLVVFHLCVVVFFGYFLLFFTLQNVLFRYTHLHIKFPYRIPLTDTV